MEENFGLYQVSLKILLKKANSYLFLTDAITGCLDFPGGRIDIGENKIPLTKILEREITEEIGKNIKYKITGPAFQYRGSSANGADVFVTVYGANYLSGSITLSSEHSDARWMDAKKIDYHKELFFSADCAAAFKNYFAKNKHGI